MVFAPVGSFVELLRLPELRLDAIAAGVLAVAVILYLARVLWIALAHARRYEKPDVKPVSAR